MDSNFSVTNAWSIFGLQQFNKKVIIRLVLKCSLFFAFLIFWQTSIAQNLKRYRFLTTSLLYDADSLYSIKDTLATISKLEEFVDRPTNRNEYYYSKALKSDLLQYVEHHIKKADICITLSNLYNELIQPEKSFEYLEKARQTYFPRYGCANGMIMYRTKLGIHYANYYLSIGEKDKAIHCLMEVFLSNESYDRKATKMLKKLWLTTYSQAEIKDEVLQGLSNMKLIPGKGESDNRFELTLFGITIDKPMYSDMQKTKEFYRNHYCIKVLMYNEKELHRLLGNIFYLF